MDFRPGDTGKALKVHLDIFNGFCDLIQKNIVETK
jgi:hypothetical protein